MNLHFFFLIVIAACLSLTCDATVSLIRKQPRNATQSRDGPSALVAKSDHIRFHEPMSANAATAKSASANAYRGNMLEVSLSMDQQRHCPNPPQRRYELLRDFVGYMTRHPTLRWTLGCGSLLGAMRQDPPGFIINDDDLDIYMPAKDLFQLVGHILHDCSKEMKSVGCGVIKPHSRDGCCGFGHRILNQHDRCAYLDLKALSRDPEPIKLLLEGGRLTSWKDHPVVSQKVWTVPTAYRVKAGSLNLIPDAMMKRESQWNKSDSEWIWNGNGEKKATVWPDDYLLESELFPLRQIQMYNITVNIPNDPWDHLKRFYGKECEYYDNFGHDLRKEPEWKKPAFVRIDGNVRSPWTWMSDLWHSIFSPAYPTSVHG